MNKNKLYLVTAGAELIGIMTYADAIAWSFGVPGGVSIALEPLD